MRRGRLLIALFAGGLLAGTLPARAAEGERAHEPTWWFGLSGAANLNLYEGTTQRLNGALTSPEPFHKGFGIGLYIAPSLEYRHDAYWGGILQLGYDDRRGAFDEILCRPCDEKASLEARPAYLSLEPSLRWSPFGGDLHLFAGPRLAFLWSPPFLNGEEKSFLYARENRPALRDAFSAMRRMVYSGQIGMGHDFEFTRADAATAVQLSPFVSYQPRFGQDPRDTDRDVEWWALSTVRVGATLKFGRRKIAPAAGEVRFSVRAPANVVAARRIHETFPLRNYVFFEQGASRIPPRYAALTPAEAARFREEQLQETYPAAPTGRSVRQIAVYHNILNIMGDRMRRNPSTVIYLTGISAQGPQHGRARAETVKRYLTEVFGIDGARIVAGERGEPVFPAGQRGADELRMLSDENQRVEISSRSPEMLVQIGEGNPDGRGEGAHFMLKPVEIEGEAQGTDSVVFQAAGSGSFAPSFLWWLEIRDGRDSLRRFGPFTRGRETLPATLLLGDSPRRDFTAVMVAQPLPREGAEERQNRAASAVRKQATFRLSQRNRGIHETVRFGILFDIDQARAVSAYEKFLTDVVAARIPDTGTVFVRGRTDVVGEVAHNYRLSRGRAQGALRSLESTVLRNGKRGVKFQPTWSGEDSLQAPFRNVFPEERAYNRTVIIDIVPE